jgi:hypothetical protein
MRQRPAVQKAFPDFKIFCILPNPLEGSGRVWYLMQSGKKCEYQILQERNLYSSAIPLCSSFFSHLSHTNMPDQSPGSNNDEEEDDDSSTCTPEGYDSPVVPEMQLPPEHITTSSNTASKLNDDTTNASKTNKTTNTSKMSSKSQPPTRTKGSPNQDNRMDQGCKDGHM